MTPSPSDLPQEARKGATSEPEIDATILGVLNEQLRLPTRYVERRTDRLVELSRDCAHWLNAMQITLPIVARRAPRQERPFLVSLGVFEKKRLPDLEVVDGTGAILPIIRRADRTRVLSLLLLQPLLRSRLVAPPAAPDLVSVSETLQQILALNSDDARALLPAYGEEVHLTFGAVAEHLNADVEAHLAAVASFANFTHVLVWVQASPGDRLTLKYTYSERHKHPELLPSLRAKGMDTTRRIRLLMRHSVMRLGLLSVPMRVRLNGANHAHSYYLMVRPPDGTEVEAIYWKALNHRGDHLNAAIVHEARDPILACYHEDHDAGGGDASVNLRIFGPGLRYAWMLAGLLLLVGVFAILRPRSQLHSLISLLAFIPGGLLALITQRNSEFEYRMSTVLKRLCLLLVLVAGLFGIAVSGNVVPGSRALVSDRHIAIVLAGCASFLFVLLGYVSFRRAGPSGRSGGGGNVALLQRSDVSGYQKARRRNSYLSVLAALALGIGVCGWLGMTDDASPPRRPRSNPTVPTSSSSTTQPTPSSTSASRAAVP